MITWVADLRTARVEQLGWCLVHSVWQGAAVAIVAAIVAASDGVIELRNTFPGLTVSVRIPRAL